MAEVEQSQRQRSNCLHPTPLIFQQRAHAARNNSARRGGGARTELVADVDARAADAHSVMEQAVAEHDFERGGAEHARELVAGGFERNTAARCSQQMAS